MQNSQVISILTIFILVSSVTTIALTLEGSDTVFAAKKSKSEDKTTTGEAASTPSTSESSNTPSPPPPPASNEDSTDGSGKSDVSSGTINPLTLLCPDGSIPVKGKCPHAIISEGTSGTKNKHKSDETTTEASTPSNAIGESNSDAGSTTTPPPSTTPDNSSSSKDSGSKDSSNTPPPPPPTTSDSSSNTSLPSNQDAGSTDGGSSGGSTDSSSGGSTKSSTTTSGNKDSSSGGSTDTGDSGNSSSSGSTPPPPTTSGSGSSGSASSSSSSSSSTTTKPSNSNTPQTGVSQSAANAATNQIINSPGSTIVNQQSIKQSVRINNEVNNIIRKNVISQSSSSAAPSSTSSSSVISNLITVKLATTSTMSRNAYLPIGDVAPYHLIGGHITANLPNNHLYVVVAQLASSNGAIQHAVVLDMIKSQISNTYETDLGSQISGTNPLTGKQDIVSDITNLFLWNNGNQQVTFVDANGITMNLIYK